jgi:hypothetical protein
MGPPCEARRSRRPSRGRCTRASRPARWRSPLPAGGSRPGMRRSGTPHTHQLRRAATSGHSDRLAPARRQWAYRACRARCATRSRRDGWECGQVPTRRLPQDRARASQEPRHPDSPGVPYLMRDQQPQWHRQRRAVSSARDQVPQRLVMQVRPEPRRMGPTARRSREMESRLRETAQRSPHLARPASGPVRQTARRLVPGRSAR